MPFLLIGLTLADVVGVTFTTRQILTEMATLRDCTFCGCQSASDGGAFCANTYEVNLCLAGSLFEKCQTSLKGGGICAYCYYGVSHVKYSTGESHD
jgi:hypothetical protein